MDDTTAVLIAGFTEVRDAIRYLAHVVGCVATLYGMFWAVTIARRRQW